jgi:hypothetical protein
VCQLRPARSATTSTVGWDVEQARKQGATRDEIADPLGVAVMVNAGAALVYSARTIDAFHAAEEAAAGPSEK